MSRYRSSILAKEPCYQLNGRLGWPQSLSVRFGEEKILLLLPGFERQESPARSRVVIQTRSVGQLCHLPDPDQRHLPNSQN